MASRRALVTKNTIYWANSVCTINDVISDPLFSSDLLLNVGSMDVANWTRTI